MVDGGGIPYTYIVFLSIFPVLLSGHKIENIEYGATTLLGYVL